MSSYPHRELEIHAKGCNGWWLSNFHSHTLYGGLLNSTRQTGTLYRFLMFTPTELQCTAIMFDVSGEEGIAQDILLEIAES